MVSSDCSDSSANYNCSHYIYRYEMYTHPLNTLECLLRISRCGEGLCNLCVQRYGLYSLHHLIAVSTAVHYVVCAPVPLSIAEVG